MTVSGLASAMPRSRAGCAPLRGGSSSTMSDENPSATIRGNASSANPRWKDAFWMPFASAFRRASRTAWPDSSTPATRAHRRAAIRLRAPAPQYKSATVSPMPSVACSNT